MRVMWPEKQRGMFDEQLALARLSWAFALCSAFGHRDPVLILHRGKMEYVCPRCGHLEG
jgi:hypothetical protein